MKQTLNNCLIHVLISKDPKLSKVRNYILRHKEYKDWIPFLRFALQRLLIDENLTQEEKLLVSKNSKIINKFSKIKRPAPYLKSHLGELKPLIEIVLNYE